MDNKTLQLAGFRQVQGMRMVFDSLTNEDPPRELEDEAEAMQDAQQKFEESQIQYNQ